MQLKHSRLMFGVSIFGLVVFSASAQAKVKKAKAAAKEPQDEISVVGHIALTDGPVSRLMITQHYSSAYLYAEHDSGKSITLIDVTKVSQPKVLADMANQPGAGAGPGSLFAVAGTAALVAAEPATPASAAASQTIRIMDFSDALHPKVAREFAGVTAISRDERRGLIFVANGEGIWILRQTLAEDPEVEKEYERQVVYAH
jgi:hypothetical protein